MINGKSKKEAIDFLYTKIKKYERDEFDIAHRYGDLPNNILDTFKELGLDCSAVSDSTCYDKLNETPQFKYWYININFVDDNNLENKIKGFILAMGNRNPKKIGKDVIQISENFDSYSLKVVLV
jgi:hypothetical protein